MTSLSWVSHGRAHALGLVELVGAQAQQQGLEGLAGAVDPDVAAGGGGQQAAQRVERFRAHCAFPGRRRVVPGPRVDSAEVLLGMFQPAGVGLERVVEDFAVAPAVGEVVDLRRGDVLPAAFGPFGEGDVAGRLLEVGHQAPALEDLRQHVGDAFAGDVCAAELGDRVVAVLAEHPVVELGGALVALVGGLVGPGSRQSGVELVEVEAAERLGRAGVAGEERSLYGLGQVAQREAAPVEVREPGIEAGCLVRGERLGGNGLGSWCVLLASSVRFGLFPDALGSWRAL